MDKIIENITPLDYYAGLAMQNAVQEMQEMIPATFWDYIKMLLVNLAHMHFLKVRYRCIPGVKEQIAKNAFLQAQEMIKEREKYINNGI